MTPVDIAVVESKAEIALREIALLKELLKKRVSSKSDIILQHALTHAIQNLTSAVIDIAQHVGSERGAAVPESYAAAIEQLGALGILPKKFALDFSAVARLRNVVVHAYAKLDIDILVRHTPKLIKDSRQFLRCVLKKM